MNRAVLLIGGVVAAGVLLVAGLLGAAVLGGSAGDGEATRSAVPVQPLSETPPALRATTSAPTATPDAPVATATATPVPTATPTPTQVSLRTPIPTPTPDPRVPAEEFEPAAIEERIVELINDRRERANLTRLDPDGGNADRLRWMTRNHSAAMAEFGSATHEIDGETSADRFEEYQLMSRCRWSKESGGIVSATRNRLEVVGTALAGQPYPGEDGQRINTNETMVAEAIAKVWWDTFYEDRLHRPGASEVGVGVHVHWTGEAYATVALCG